MPSSTVTATGLTRSSLRRLSKSRPSIQVMSCVDSSATMPPRALHHRPSQHVDTAAAAAQAHACLEYPPSATLLKGHPSNRKSALARRIPPGSWDSHMHIVDPDKFPLAANALYRPSTHALGDALDFESSVGLEKIVLVQPSIYGFDNSCMLEALRKIGPRRARAVVSFDPATTPPSQLRRWHEMGVRGARLNLQSTTTVMSPAKLEATLRQYAAAVKPFDWVMQVYVPMPLIDVLEPIVPTLGVRFCIDHIGHPCLDGVKRCRDPYELPGFKALVRLLQGGQTYVKISAPYRCDVGGQRQSHVEAISRELIRLKGRSRLVFATDWPHTRFEGLDIRPWMETVLDWCDNDQFLVERLFRGNAEELWGADHH